MNKTLETRVLGLCPYLKPNPVILGTIWGCKKSFTGFVTDLQNSYILSRYPIGHASTVKLDGSAFRIEVQFEDTADLDSTLDASFSPQCMWGKPARGVSVGKTPSIRSSRIAPQFGLRTPYICCAVACDHI